MRSTQRTERSRIRAAFHRTADAYDRHARVQRRVIDRFLDLLGDADLRPRRLLDVGSGTGILLARLRSRYPAALTVGLDLALGMCRAARRCRPIGPRAALVCADAERLPFVDGAFDAVVSTSVFQWLPSLDVALAEIHRTLKPGGLFAFTLFGGRTLFELKESYREALRRSSRDRDGRLRDTFPAGGVRAALAGAGFRDYLVRSELDVERYPDVADLLRALKRTGTGSPVPAAGFAERRILAEAIAVYRTRFGQDGSVPATYETIFAVGWK